jgi:hypothetical protein
MIRLPQKSPFDVTTGNLFAITEAGAGHPMVRQRLAQKPAISAENAAIAERIMRHGLRSSDHDKQMAALRRYKADTISMYVEAVKTQVWGRDARRLDPFIDDLMESALGDIQQTRMAA